jgi:hypothetical protein
MMKITTASSSRVNPPSAGGLLIERAPALESLSTRSELAGVDIGVLALAERHSGKKQQDEILKADYESNLKDARSLMDLARSFEEDLEKEDRFILSLSSLKKLDEIDKLTKRIRGRLKHY